MIVSNERLRRVAESEDTAGLRRAARRCNELDGRKWLQNSISVWSDLKKTADEQRLKHPAQFPVGLVERLIESFLPAGMQAVLDPFCGSGSTLVAAQRMGKRGIGIEISAEYVALAQSRIAENDSEKSRARSKRTNGNEPDIQPLTSCAALCETVIHHASTTRVRELLPDDSIDLCITSPPYWNILNQKRTADFKSIRHYGNLDGDLGRIPEYEDYLTALTAVFKDVLHTLKPGAHCAIVVMDLRKRDRFYPLHSDLASRLQAVGYRWDDLVIWNRQAEYNNLRPLGYPAVFRVNKVHEFILLMQKPKDE